MTSLTSYFYILSCPLQVSFSSTFFSLFACFALDSRDHRGPASLHLSNPPSITSSHSHQSSNTCPSMHCTPHRLMETQAQTGRKSEGYQITHALFSISHNNDILSVCALPFKNAGSVFLLLILLFSDSNIYIYIYIYIFFFLSCITVYAVFIWNKKIIMNFLLKMLFSQKILSYTAVFNIDNKIYIFWAPNQHIRMISEGSCDTEDWSNGCRKFYFASQE